MSLDSPWFTALLKVSAQASVLILLVLLARWIFGQRLQPQWRCALWLLVVLRLAIPWTIPSRASLFNVLKFPAKARPAEPQADPLELATPASLESTDAGFSAGVYESGKIGFTFVWLWAAGALSLAACAAVNHYKIHRSVAGRRPLTESPTLDLLEDGKELMGVTAPVTLIETEAVDSPALFGFVRPRLLLPAGMTARFSRDELRHVFLHELAHVKRHDILASWLMLALQILHWFNPLVWFAFYRLRVDRELACDALALACAGADENESYGLTIVKLLEGFGRRAFSPGLAGILEKKQRMTERINMIAKYNPNNRPALAVALIAVLALATFTDAQNESGHPPAFSQQLTRLDSPPRIVATSPAVGAEDVDPATKEITVTFDRDMSGGMSWTGGGPEFPQSPDGSRARWLADKRTCVLPVKLETGRYYRVGINSTSFRNFRSTEGVSAQISTIYFTTAGASEETKQKLKVPFVVSLNPANGASGVDPHLKQLRVTFNMPMGDGFSWCGGGEQFPAIPEGKGPHWSADHKTCFLPVALKPGWSYELGLNCPSAHNFCSASGIALEPITYRFKTVRP